MDKKLLRRGAGVLLHISSLPGKFSCGDFGPDAYKFVKQLRKAGQEFWQILPLNPLDSTKAYSPYSPLSAFAGNYIFISPEMLIKDGLLPVSDSIPNRRSGRKTEFGEASQLKLSYLESAYQYFKLTQPDGTEEFNNFCQKEAGWLEEFALYIVLRDIHMLPWYKWPKALRDRDTKALKKVRAEYQSQIEREKFIQFLFFKQWKRLKHYAKKQGIRIVGDIPIYISHDSADVWANPQYFKLTAGKSIAQIAGVPPDYFNDKGQLWNMPVYNWRRLENDNYSWWIQRLKKNLELFDIVRLDHFRGFSSYWEVKGGSEHAIDGFWRKGPGEKLFDAIKKEFPEMPFIAEDLGDIDQPVFDLRDKYNLPGMRILQFAFEGDMAHSIFIPHNYTPNSIVYTGTHDNNTVKGWYKNEASKKGKKNLKKYLNIKLAVNSIHNALIRECYKSIANVVIVPMQDVLGKGEKHRMNYPSTEEGNWQWRMKKNDFSRKYIRKLKQLCLLYNR